MAQSKDNDNLKEFFSNDGSFDSLLEEKLKGWTKEPSQVEILDSIKVNPTPKNVSAGQDSVNTGNSEETEESKELSESSSVTNVVGHIDNKDDESDVYTTGISDEVKYDKPESNPDYTRAILEGKVERIAIHGIQKGPWANPQVVTEIVSGEEALKNIGQHKLSEVWQRAARSAVACRGNVDKIREHIMLLQIAASNIEWYKHTLIEALKTVMRDGSAEERAKAEAEYARIYRERAARPHTDSGDKVEKKRRGNGEVKSEKLGVKEMEGLDLVISLCNKNYDMIVGMIKQKGDVAKLEAKIAYIRKSLRMEN